MDKELAGLVVLAILAYIFAAVGEAMGNRAFSAMCKMTVASSALGVVVGIMHEAAQAVAEAKAKWAAFGDKVQPVIDFFTRH